MILKVKDREFDIKFAYIPTVKSGLVKKLVGFENSKTDEKEDIIQDLLIILPEMLLAGLQKNHYAEFGCDYDDKVDVSKCIDAVGNLIDAYCEQDDVSLMGLFGELQEEMYTNGFLSKLLEQEKQKVEKKPKNTKSKEN